MKNNQSGFGLVEAMITAGVIGVLAVVLISLNKQSATTLVKSKVDQESLLIINEAVAILSNPTNCMATLGGLDASSTSVGTILNIKRNGIPKFAVGSLSGDAQLKIKSYSLSAAGPDVSLATNTTHLQVNFERKNMQGGTGDVIKKMRLHVEVDGANRITNCRSLSSASTDIWTRGNNGDIYYSGGKVGIGIVAPRSSLEVIGGVRALKGDTSSADMSNVGFAFENDGDTGMFAVGGTDTLGSTIKLKTDSNIGLEVKDGKYYGTQECVTVTGTPGLNGARVDCPVDTQLQTGGGYCTNGVAAALHHSAPDGNGWLVDCFLTNGSGDSPAVAIARCCRVTPP